MTEKELQKRFNEALIQIYRPTTSKWIGRGKQKIRYVRHDVMTANASKMTIAVEDYLRQLRLNANVKVLDSIQERSDCLGGVRQLIAKVLRSLKLRR